MFFAGNICPPETNIATENGWLEYYFPFGKAYFQVQTVSFREVTQGSLPKVHVSTTGNHWEICEASG